MTLLTWIGIAFCLSQSAILSGLNLGLFARSKLELQVAAKKGDTRAERVLALREDSNFALVTILWSNVSVNVLLALLSGSVLGGVAAFLFSTVIITIFAEILPQSYFSRHATRVASLLFPVLRFYQVLMYPIARPTAWILDAWLGGENVRYFPERDLHKLIELHVETTESEIERVEGRGARNFLELDDIPLHHEGGALDPDSIVRLDFSEGSPVFPQISRTPDDPFLQQIGRTECGWTVLVDDAGEARMVLRPGDFLRDALFGGDDFNPRRHCHHPIVVKDPMVRLGQVISRLKVRPASLGDTIVGDDVILVWADEPRIVTGTDILGRLLRGIGQVTHHE